MANEKLKPYQVIFDSSMNEYWLFDFTGKRLETTFKVEQLANRYCEDLNNSHAAALATSQAVLAEAERVIKALLWPNVPSADDFAVLVGMVSASAERHREAMKMVECLRVAQLDGDAALLKIRAARGGGA